jgi:hypothetical protein
MGETIRIHQDTAAAAGVTSFNTRTGAVVPEAGDYDTSQVAETTDKNYVTDAEKVTIANTSGTNTGDETPSSIKTKYESNPDTNAFTDSEKLTLSNQSGTNTGDETAASIKVKYESNANTNAFTDADVLNLSNQSGTNTGDETALSIKTKYESNADTNAFTDTEKLNLSNQSGTNTGDETAASIKSKYESNPDTNAFTDAEKINLSNQSGTNTGDETTLSIQTKRPLKTINLQSIEGIGNINISGGGFDPVAEKVLTGYFDNQSLNQQTTNATLPNLATYLTLVVAGLDITSFYRFQVSFSISHDATNTSALVDIKDFGVSILQDIYTVEPKDNSNRSWVTISGKLQPNPLGAGQIQLQLDFGTENANNDTTLYFAYMQLQKIN